VDDVRQRAPHFSPVPLIAAIPGQRGACQDLPIRRTRSALDVCRGGRTIERPGRRGYPAARRQTRRSLAVGFSWDGEASCCWASARTARQHRPQSGVRAPKARPQEVSSAERRRAGLVAIEAGHQSAGRTEHTKCSFGWAGVCTRSAGAAPALDELFAHPGRVRRHLASWMGMTRPRARKAGS
jgi:hypothetical protein